MNKQVVKDALDEMTKEDLVAWIRSHHFSRPKRSDVLYLRCGSGSRMRGA